MARERVSTLFEDATARRVALVSAPAGAGKTVACAAWAASSGRRIGWLTLDGADNDPHRFWAYLLATLRRAVSTCEPGDLPVGTPTPPADLDACLAQILVPADVPAVLVLDDVHTITDPTLWAGLETLIRHLPPWLRIVLSGRAHRLRGAARLRLSGDLADIGRTQLAATREEAAAILELLGLRLSADEVETLMRRTEGWLAGLRLWALSRRGHTAADHRTPAHGSGDRLVMDYLRDEVLSRYAPQARLFLRRTAVVECLDGELAGQLTGMPNSTRILDWLSRENGFVEAVETEPGRYRYHPMFRELLLAELRRHNPHELRPLLRRAARWYATGGGAPLRALRYAIAARDWDYAARVLLRYDSDILAAAGGAALTRVLARFPAERTHVDPVVAAALALGRLAIGDPHGAASYLRAAQRQLAASPDRAVLELKLAALRLAHRAMCAPIDADLLEESQRRVDQPATAPQPPAVRAARGFLLYILALTYLRRGELRHGRAAIQRAGEEFHATGLTVLASRAAAWRRLVDAINGDLTAVEREIIQREPAADFDHGDTGGESRDATVAGLTDLALAYVHYERDQLAAARALLEGVTHRSATAFPGEPELTVLAGVSLVRVLLADGEVATARRELARLRRQPPAAVPVGPCLLDLLDGEISLRAEAASDVRGLAAHGGRPKLGYHAVVMGRARLAADDPRGALSAVADCLSGRLLEVRDLDLIAARLVATVAHHRLGASEHAVGELEEALALAEPRQAVRVFLDAGRPVRSLLTAHVPTSGRQAAFRKHVLHRFQVQVPTLRSCDVETERPAPAVPRPALTDSELVVLRFLASHLTNEEIAADLCLSINTVKSHLRGVYRKLGVSSRREAVAVADRAGLL